MEPLRAHEQSRSATDESVVLALEGCWKRFGPTQALSDVDLELRQGEIHALLGSNGSGKSTLVKILAGVEHADRGVLRIGEHRIDARKVELRDAHEYGVRVVHQADSTFGCLTVTENLAARDHFVTGPGARVRWGELRRRTQAILDRFEIDADPDERVENLPPARRRMLAIARVLQGRASEGGVLVLDEPTAALPKPEVSLLLHALRRYAAAGESMIYVTHHLDEVPGFADRATVLRDGKVSAVVEGVDLTTARLVRHICGRELVSKKRSPRSREPERPRLELHGLSVGPVTGVDLSVAPGETVGLAGITGSGRSSLLQAIFGLFAPSAGEILIEGKQRAATPPTDGTVAYVPEDRVRDAAFRSLTLRDNLSAAGVGEFRRGLRLRHALEARAAAKAIEQFEISAPSDQVPFSVLSGGNQQKAILARWMRRNPRLLLLDEPSSGVDVGARTDIHYLIGQAADAGCAVLVASSDFDELIEISDRIVVLFRGHKIADLDPADTTRNELERLAHAGAPA